MVLPDIYYYKNKANVNVVVLDLPSLWHISYFFNLLTSIHFYSVSFVQINTNMYHSGTICSTGNTNTNDLGILEVNWLICLTVTPAG